MQKKNLKIVIVLILAATLAAFFYFDLHHLLTLQALKEKQGQFYAHYQANPIQTMALFTLIYILSNALSIPGAGLLTLLAGALFGLVRGSLIVSFASTIGATLAFLTARFLMRDYVQSKFGEQLKKINEGFRKEGQFYLLSLRLIPIFPFFMINLLMGLTPMSTLSYALVSMVGMFPATVLYVNAGIQLAQIDNPKDILSFELFLSFVLLGLFPLLAKFLIKKIRNTKGAANDAQI